VAHEPGAKVSCVCTHDAVRVLQRSSAVPIADPVAEELGALSSS
jgi:spermidine/putrescine transport system ATP-binding protein